MVNMPKQKGFGLIIAITLTGILLSITAAIGSICLISLKIQKSQIDYAQAFYLAESGIEYAKDKLGRDPNWYTDLAHSPPNDKDWILNQARGLKMNGQKLIKEKNTNLVYALGYSGKSPANPLAYAIIRWEYASPSLKQLDWEEL